MCTFRENKTPSTHQIAQRFRNGRNAKYCVGRNNSWKSFYENVFDCMFSPFHSLRTHRASWLQEGWERFLSLPSVLFFNLPHTCVMLLGWFEKCCLIMTSVELCRLEHAWNDDSDTRGVHFIASPLHSFVAFRWLSPPPQELLIWMIRSFNWHWW